MGDMQNDNFNAQVIEAVDEVISYYNTIALPRVQEIYRNHLILVRNLFDSLQRRSIITPDPYKHDKKIMDVVCPEEKPFGENERNQQLGVRLSDYESVLDYICTYVKFSVDQLPTGKVKKLIEFNKSFTWKSLSPTATKFNSKALGTALNEYKTTTQGMGVGMLMEGIFKTGEDLDEANKVLKDLGAFQKERYKAEIRRTVVSKLDEDSRSSAMEFMDAIRMAMPTAMPKRPFSEEIVQELVDEETAPNKNDLRLKLMERLKVDAPASAAKKEAGPDLHEIIMAAVRSFGSMADQYSSVLGKVVANHDVLQAESNNFKQKILRLIRHMFSLSEPPVEYEVLITKAGTEQKQREIINYSSFIEALSKRIKFYASLNATGSPNFQNMSKQTNEFIFNFVNKQVSDNSRLQVLLAALDEYFKQNAGASNRSKIKGISMELTTLKNLLVNANQSRSEYAGYMEEESRLKKMGMNK